MSDAFWNGLWSGIFELIAIGGVAGWINFVYQRIRSRQELRRDLIEEIDLFSSALYKPRKLYQLCLTQRLEEPSSEQVAPNQIKYLEEFTDAAGRFRALQVKMVPLFGFNIELFAHYLAVWEAVRSVRKRMERGVDLYAAHETQSSSDALYRMLDQFRYQVQVTPSVRTKPSLLSPPDLVESEIKRRAHEIYTQYLQVGMEGVDE